MVERNGDDKFTGANLLAQEGVRPTVYGDAGTSAVGVALGTHRFRVGQAARSVLSAVCAGCPSDPRT